MRVVLRQPRHAQLGLGELRRPTGGDATLPIAPGTNQLSRDDRKRMVVISSDVLSYEVQQPLKLTPNTKSRRQVQHKAANVNGRERVTQNALYLPTA